MKKGGKGRKKKRPVWRGGEEKLQNDGDSRRRDGAPTVTGKEIGAFAVSAATERAAWQHDEQLSKLTVQQVAVPPFLRVLPILESHHADGRQHSSTLLPRGHRQTKRSNYFAERSNGRWGYAASRGE